MLGDESSQGATFGTASSKQHISTGPMVWAILRMVDESLKQLRSSFREFCSWIDRSCFLRFEFLARHH